MNVDIHSHYIPPAYLDLIREDGNPFGRSLTRMASGQLAMRAYVRDFPLEDGFHDAAARLAEMDAQGVACQVVSPSPSLFHYDLPIARTVEVARLYNDEALALAERHPGRFAPMATLPLQDVDKGIEELERVVGRLGIRAVSIGASIGERELDEPALAPFWQAAERLGVLVFIHPIRPPGRERMAPYHLFNLIGFLVESTLAAARLIFSGTLERHPDVKICLAHAGGMALWIQGRFDHALETMEVCRGNISRPPSEYLKRFYYDTIAHRPQALAYVAEAVGPGRMLMGTDYPFAIGDPDPVGTIDAMPGASAADRLAIKGGNAARLLGLPRGG